VAVDRFALEVVYALKQNERRIPTSLEIHVRMSVTESLGTVMSYPTSPLSLGGIMRFERKRAKEIYVTVLHCEEGLVDLASESLQAAIVCRGTSQSHFGDCYEVLVSISWSEELQSLCDSSRQSFTAKL